MSLPGDLEIAVTMEGSARTLGLSGRVDEETKIEDFRGALGDATAVVFELKNLGYINSAGVRNWCQFIGAVDPAVSIAFRRCSLTFCAQASMVVGVLGHGVVESLYAPYVCEECEEESEQYLEVADIMDEVGTIQLPEFRCPDCDVALEFDDIPERYFAFLVG